MKKLFALIFAFFMTLQIYVCANQVSSEKYIGRWTEKVSERVVMDIYTSEDNSEYQVYITWREDNLAQKDIYRFMAKPDINGNLLYKNGLHIYRYFDKKNDSEDKVDYNNGTGTIELRGDELIWTDNKDNSKTEFIRANNDLLKDSTAKNELFSITLPEELKGSYEVKKEKDKISLYHKESKKLGFGGFAFGIKAYKEPSEHAVLPGSRKIGELTDKNGVLYDIVLKHPTDVQYDYTKSSNAPEDFKLLYDIGDVININGENGSKYFKNQGMKGQDLYKDILEKHIAAINEKWDSAKLEAQNMSYMYNIIPQKDKIGYAYYDVNVDGIDELLIGEIAQGTWKGVIYDIYTMVDRKPHHVISGGARNRFFVCDDAFICNEYSSGASESGVRVYNLVENSTELFPQVNFKYDGYTNSKKPWFVSYSDEKWQNVTKAAYDERKKVFDKYERFDFVPLNNVAAAKMNKSENIQDKYNSQKDYFDYSVVLQEFPKDYYYTTVKINKSKERILIITDKINENKNSYHGLFYYFANNGFVYPLGYLESTKPLAYSKNYLYLNNGTNYIKFYMSDRKLEIKKSTVSKVREYIDNIVFDTIGSADKFSGEFGSPAGDDIKKVYIDGFYFEYHKPQYKKDYIKQLMQECINDGVKTQVQMYCCMVKKLHP